MYESTFNYVGLCKTRYKKIKNRKKIKMNEKKGTNKNKNKILTHQNMKATFAFIFAYL